MNPVINLDDVWDEPTNAAEWCAKLPEPSESASDD